jgi:dienelactone hydrolase
MPDYFAGDPIPENAMSSPSFDREGWRSRHGKDITRPYLDKVILALKQTGVEIFAATGYCFGARYCVDLALDGAVQVIALTHPSMLQVPADFEVEFVLPVASGWPLTSSRRSKLSPRSLS